MSFGVGGKEESSCKIAVYKVCQKCQLGFVDKKWCGELMCQRCLDLCWIINDESIVEKLFNCCDYHRPQVSLNNMNVLDDMHIFTDYQNQILDDLTERFNAIQEIKIENSEELVIPPLVDSKEKVYKQNSIKNVAGKFSSWVKELKPS